MSLPAAFTIRTSFEAAYAIASLTLSLCGENPLPKLVTNKDQWVYDVVYTPAKTDFLKKAESNKSKIIYGIDLFVFQGIEAFILFTDQEKLRKTIYKKVKEIRSYYFKKLIN